MAPVGINPITVFEFPLFNTFLLIISGFSVTWAHRAVALGDVVGAIDAFIVTILLGFFFIGLQSFEYYEAVFNMSDSVYACSFYMLTVYMGAMFSQVLFF